MPSKTPPHKHTDIAEYHRTAMVKLACQYNKKLYSELIELSLPSPSYTVKTLQVLKEQSDNTICFLIGADSLYNLTTWYAWDTLLDYCHLVVMRRGEQHYSPPDDILPWIEAHTTKDVSALHQRENGHVFLADTELVTISSTQIRTSVKQNHVDGLEKWVFEPVLNYIQQHELYK